MKLFATDDISASVHKAHADFTHVVLNRGYTLIKPVYFKTVLLNDLPAYQYASWLPTDSQLTGWRDNGGVLVEQDTHPKWVIRAPDVTVTVECPYTMDRIEKCNQRNAEYGVLPRPVSWSTHEECIDLRFPVEDLLRDIWKAAAGQQMTNAELARETGIAVQHLQYMKNALCPRETWAVHKRLAPERDEFVEAYDWLEDGELPKGEITVSGYKSQIEEMARFGYITLKKMQKYAREEPDWRKMEKKREDALNDLAAVRLLVESLPNHLEE